jgi:hypothetical protein
MQAEDVHQLGYGDCKGLTNYTKALLSAIGVESYYTVVYGDRDIRSMDANFSSLEGNHVILSIPNNDDYVWLECTSQDAPFGYNANFTDNRDVLIIKPEGGEIVHTTEYKTLDNTQITKAELNLDNQGDLITSLNITYKGSQYDNHTHLESKPIKDQELFYKKNYSHINNLQVVSHKFKNDKDSIVFKEYLNLKAPKYALKAGDRLLLTPNVFNQKTYVPPKYDERKLPFEIDRGYTDIDEYIFTISDAYNIERLYAPIEISNKFGSYTVVLEKIEPTTLSYKRSLIINKGKYSKQDYEAFRQFNLEIVTNDRVRIALKQKQ